MYSKNMKVSKVFRRIFNDNEFIIVDRLYGNALKNNFKEGNLCISIDPVDFLTMSENSLNWTSCHCLSGEFRAGILSLLGDNCTALCYLEHAGKPYFYNDEIPVTNKLWRCLVHIHPISALAIFNYGYPYQHDYLVEEAANKLSELFEEETTFDFLATDESQILFFLDDYDTNGYLDDTLHYNDLLISRNNGGDHEDGEFVPALFSDLSKIDEPMIVGSYVICPICGNGMVEHPRSLECENCDPMEYCCTCASARHAEELHEMDGEFYCDDCFDNEFTYCDECDEIVRRVYVISGEHVCKEEDLHCERLY